MPQLLANRPFTAWLNRAIPPPCGGAAGTGRAHAICWGFSPIVLIVLSTLGLGNPFLPSRSDAAAGKEALASLSNLAWMAGCWGAEENGVVMEECWTAPGGGILLGMHRDVTPSGKAFFEFLRISAADDTITYWGSPMGKTPTAFRMKEQGPNRVVFENVGHDYPQRIIYWMDGDHTLRARVEGTERGAERNEEWSWKRADSPAPAKAPIQKSETR